MKHLYAKLKSIYIYIYIYNTKGNNDSLRLSSAPLVSCKQIIAIIVTAISAITLLSKSSPIYPFNDWFDSNCFLTVGKSMLHGLVPYKDLYEQKGPLLYMLHAVAAMFSETSFIGGTPKPSLSYNYTIGSCY